MSWDGSRLAVFAVFPDTRSKDLRADQGAETADDLYRCGTCEIMETKLRQEASAPDPVSGYRVNEDTDRRAVGEIGDEFRPLRHRA